MIALDKTPAETAVFLQDVFGNPLSADQEFEAGFTCNGVRATPTTPLPSPCQAPLGSSLIEVPAESGARMTITIRHESPPGISSIFLWAMTTSFTATSTK